MHLDTPHIYTSAPELGVSTLGLALSVKHQFLPGAEETLN